MSTFTVLAVVTTYRKRHIPGGIGVNRKGQSAGDVPGIFETPFGRVGLMICYDAEHDGMMRKLASNNDASGTAAQR